MQVCIFYTLYLIISEMFCTALVVHFLFFKNFSKNHRPNAILLRLIGENKNYGGN